ncbi:hypothetical protein HPB48_021577 [Haemaphysalis longicornis]|uniref:Uncharacterized protein n=1 Tax=Haemaphysalis longicornis TaxID=44386 RepID=A0A9J6H3C5_HAELO|nr:hypothetical protein HPB48_021577 [Haemaphysalis longicornis]
MLMPKQTQYDSPVKNRSIGAERPGMHLETAHSTDDFCNAVNGDLHISRVWNVFRSHLEWSKPRHTLQELVLAQHLDKNALIEEIRDTFYPPCTHRILTVEYISDQPNDMNIGNKLTL